MIVSESPCIEFEIIAQYREYTQRDERRETRWFYIYNLLFAFGQRITAIIITYRLFVTIAAAQFDQKTKKKIAPEIGRHIVEAGG